MSVTGSPPGAAKKARNPQTAKKKNRGAAVPASASAKRPPTTSGRPADSSKETGASARPPVRGPLPRSFRAATVIVAVEAAFTLGYAVYLTFASAFGHPKHRNQGIAEGIYLLILGLGIALAVYGMVRGRRWSRSPAITVNLIVVGLGYWLIRGSGRDLIGAVVLATGVACIAILVTPTVHKALEGGRGDG